MTKAVDFGRKATKQTGYKPIPFPDIYHILNAHTPCHLIQVSKKTMIRRN